MIKYKPHCESYLIGQPYCSKKPNGSIGCIDLSQKRKDGSSGYDICAFCYRKIFKGSHMLETETEQWARHNKLEAIINEIKYYCPEGLREENNT